MEYNVVFTGYGSLKKDHTLSLRHSLVHGFLIGIDNEHADFGIICSCGVYNIHVVRTTNLCRHSVAHLKEHICDTLTITWDNHALHIFWHEIAHIFFPLFKEILFILLLGIHESFGFLDSLVILNSLGLGFSNFILSTSVLSWPFFALLLC